MVVFTCNHCGESLQKPKVEKHYFTVCRTAKFVTCVDCFKDFRNEEYVAHTKCVTEEERYAAKGSLPQGVVKKGEVKQQSWTEMIQSVVQNAPNASSNQQKILNLMANHPNIPRKRMKFINFVKSSLNNRANMQDIEYAWNLIEKEKAQQVGNTPTGDKADETENNSVEGEAPKKKKKKSKAAEENGVAEATVEPEALKMSDKKIDEVENGDQQELLKKKKKKKSKTIEVETTAVGLQQENQKFEVEAKEDELKTPLENGKKNKKSKHLNGDLNGSTETSKKKKRKSENLEGLNGENEVKRIKSENSDVAKETSNSKKRKSKSSESVDVKESDDIPSKKKKETESVSNGHGEVDKSLNDSQTSDFSFEEKILEVLRGKNNVSLKKLEKKVLNSYYKQTGTEPSEKMVKKFNKKLKKVNGIDVSENNVRLIDS